MSYADFKFTTWVDSKSGDKQFEFDVVARVNRNDKNGSFYCIVEEAKIRSGKPGKAKTREIYPKGSLLVALTTKAEETALRMPLSFLQEEPSGFEYD